MVVELLALSPVMAPSPHPVVHCDPNTMQQLDSDDSYTLTDLDRCAEPRNQPQVNDVPYVGGVLEGLDYEGPSTSGYRTNPHLDRLCENGVFETRYEDEDQEIHKYYYMAEDSLEDVISQLEDELRKEEKESQEKVAATEKMIEEMEKSAKHFVHVRELIKKRNKQKKITDDVREEKNRIIEIKRQLALANKNTILFCCFVCSKVFIDEEVMRKHISEKHLAAKKEYQHKCQACYRVFKSKVHLRRHAETHKSATMSCSVCKREFRESVSLKIHMSKEHSLSIDGQRIEKTHECKCGEKFGVVEELKRHKYYCEAKDKIAERRRQARLELDAMSSITGISNTTSSPPESVISSSSSSATTPSIGSASGRPVKDKSCPFCFLVCASMQSRRRHIERKHPELINDPRVEGHDYVKVITPALPYACDTCYKTFASHASLSLHKKRIHENMNIYECTTCGRSYPLPSELRKHVKRVHEKNMTQT